MNIIVTETGEIRTIWNAQSRCLAELGDVTVRRASHIVPSNRLLRWGFRQIRKRVSDESRLAAWTRTWCCTWLADLSPSGGPMIGPFRSRNQALAAEHDWLERHQFPSAVEADLCV